MKRFFPLLVFLLPSTSLAQLDSLIICIDPGHGGYGSNDRHVVPDPGIDFWESESNFYKALLLKDLLEAQGATVLLTRTTNDNTTTYPDHPSGDPYEPSLSARWQFANANVADWFHSIHSNASGLASNTTINRTIILLKEDISTRQPVFPDAVIMSSHMYNQIRAHLRTASSAGNISGYPGVYKDYTFYGGTNGGFNLGVLNGLTMPGELSEGSFHDYFPETRRLMNNDYRKMEAHALTKAFLQYYSAPAYTQGIIAGIQTNSATGVVLNGTVVRILPENRTYTGDMFNNGFYMFDSLAAGPHTIVFDTPRFTEDSVDIMVTGGGIHFVDRALSYFFPTVLETTPADNDTLVAATAQISIRFSNPMDTASVRQALSISPALDASLAWTPDLKFLTIIPVPEFAYYTSYTVTIDSAAIGVNGNQMDLDGDEIAGDTLSLIFKTEPALQADALAFGQVRKDDSSSVLLNIVNRASYDIALVNISNVTSEFRTYASLPDTVDATDTMKIEVFFKPTTYGSFSDSFVVSSDSGEITVPVTGSSPAPNLLLSYPFLAFGSVQTDTSKDGPFFIRTSSINGVHIDSIYTKTSAFSYSPQLSFPQTLEPTDTLFLTITFSPQVQGTVYDTLIVLNSSSVAIAKAVLTGNGVVSSVEQVTGVVERFDLLQNYPNPFNPETMIEFHIAETTPVILEVLDILGRRIRTLVSRDFSQGVFRTHWDGRDEQGVRLSSGVYFYRLTAGSNVFSRRMLLLK